ncbi:hypothetical protein P7K49_029796, partial [Saguinus oedipus]
MALQLFLDHNELLTFPHELQEPSGPQEPPLAQIPEPDTCALTPLPPLPAMCKAPPKATGFP